MLIVMVLHAAMQSDTAANETYLTSTVRAVFVLALIGMMFMLFVIIKVHDRKEKHMKKKAAKTATREWSKFRGGVKLIQKHAGELGASDDHPGFERSNEETNVRPEHKLHGLKGAVNRWNLLREMNHIAQLGHRDEETVEMEQPVAPCAAQKLLAGRWDVEIAELLPHSDKSTPSSRPARQADAHHYQMVLWTARAEHQTARAVAPLRGQIIAVDSKTKKLTHTRTGRMITILMTYASANTDSRSSLWNTACAFPCT